MSISPGAIQYFIFPFHLCCYYALCLSFVFSSFERKKKSRNPSGMIRIVRRCEINPSAGRRFIGKVITLQKLKFHPSSVVIMLITLSHSCKDRQASQCVAFPDNSLPERLKFLCYVDTMCQSFFPPKVNIS